MKSLDNSTDYEIILYSDSNTGWGVINVHFKYKGLYYNVFNINNSSYYIRTTADTMGERMSDEEYIIYTALYDVYKDEEL